MWPQEYIELKLIEDLLVCGICYEYMETSVITSCSHNYCSLCIRKYLHYKTQCPVCFAETFEKDLRKNKVLDEIITQFSQIKDRLKKCLRNQIDFLPFNRSDIILNTPKSVHRIKEKHLIKQDDKIINKSFTSMNNGSPSSNVQLNISSPGTSGNSRIPLMFTPRSAKRSNVTVVEKTDDVICPVCKVTISEMHINRHLDDCLKRESIKNRPQVRESNRQPLPKLVFTLMKEAVIRKKLKEFGLSTQGDRRVMETRLQRYIVLYNAECDKSNPRPVSDLIKQCEDEENLEKNIYKTSSFINKLQVNRNTEENVINEERKKYLETYKDSFETLIRKIQRTDPPRNSFAKRNLLNEHVQSSESILHIHEAKDENSDHSVTESDKNESMNLVEYIEDSDSDTNCPLQVYSSTHSIKLHDAKLNSSNKDIPKNEFECYEEHVDTNLDILSDISVSNKDTPMDTDSTNVSSILKDKVPSQRKEELSLNDEISSMDSITTNTEDFDPNNVLDHEEADRKSTSVLQDVLCDLSSNDSIDSKCNSEISRSIDHEFLNDSAKDLSNMEKENINLTPGSSGSRSLRKRDRDPVQNDNRIVSSVKKKMKKLPQYHDSETDESNNEESLRALNNNANNYVKPKSRLKKRVLNTLATKDTPVLRKSVRKKFK
ncbi:E3 ubiquitin-protein ligase RAD18-like, partial [Colletes gigas]|uniref:E3 ubiquitin-protein ligase RAD18-like n=1 Tax=Colletes gigas TaxID=935657 RepID=UPI001C9BADDA